MTKPATVRAVIYTRVSTEKQIEGTSLGTQQAICRALIADRQWELVDEFEDAGISGSDATRPAWVRLLRGAEAGLFDAVFVYDLDRWSRDMNDGMRAIRQLEEAGVRLHDSKNPGINAASDEAFLSTGVGMLVSEQYKRQMVKRTVAGQRAKAALGGWPGGEPSFGWRQEGLKRTAKPVADDREREVIMTVLNLLVKRRMTTGQVADYLNEAGLHPRRAKRWEYQTIRQAFTNPTLWTGTYLWGAADGRTNLQGRHHTKTDREGNPKYGAPIAVQMGNPPLTQAEFKSIQRALARRSIAKTLAAPKTQLLSGRLYGDCGEHYNGVTLTAKEYDVYRCSGRRHRANAFEKCTCSQVRADAIDNHVWGEIVKLLGDPSRLESMAREWLEVPEDSDLTDSASVISGLDKQIAKVERSLSRATDDYYEADNPEDHRQRMDRYRSELSDLRERRAGYASLQLTVQARAERLTDLAQLAERAAGRLEWMPAAQRREVIEILDVRAEMSLLSKSGPAHLRISGQIDPRLFGNTDVGEPSCRSCSSSCR